jgi:hypothetical protein
MTEVINDWNEYVSHAICDIKTKVCIKCGIDKPLSEYRLSGGTKYLRTECIVCNKYLNSVRKKLKAVTPKPPHDYHCPICGCNEDEANGRGNKKNGPWALDHDHITETFRAWLCHSCNRAIGNFGDNLERLTRALIYLKTNGKGE